MKFIERAKNAWLILRGKKTTRYEYFWDYMREKERADRAEALLKGLIEGRDLRRAEHVRLLGEKIKKLRREVTIMRKCAENHNAVSYATGLIVRCTGCDAGAPDKFEQLTEEKVRAVEEIAHRLRTWWRNHDSRERRKLKV